MQFVRFRNGADAPEIVLEEKFETKAEASSQLAHLTRTYGTVPDAAAWLDGDDPPKHLDGGAEEPKPVAALRRHRADRKKAKASKAKAAPKPEPEPEPEPAPPEDTTSSTTLAVTPPDGDDLAKLA